MKTITTIIALLITIHISAQGPQLQIKSQHDFGTLQSGDRVEYDFLIVNIGDEPLVISNTKSSCGCDVASLRSRLPVMPGDSVYMTYKYDSKRIGPINKSVTITSNDPIHPTVVVRTKGNIIKKESDVLPVK
ncbi:MAG: hypothetical protein ACI9J3_000282 [Parvicellaceae bacterium]|jgi:hypothetical protein